MRFVSVHVVHPYGSIDTIAARKKSHFILSDRSDFHMIDNRSIAVHTFARRILISLSADETLLLRYVNLSTNFRGQLFRVDMAPSRLKHMYFVLFAFTWWPIPVPGYSAGIRLGSVYLQEALFHLHSLRPL